MAITIHYINRFVKSSWLLMEVATCIMGSVVLNFIRFLFLMMPVAMTLWLMSMGLMAVLYSKSSWYDAYTTASVLCMRLCVRHIARIPSHLSHVHSLNSRRALGVQAKQLLRQALSSFLSPVTSISPHSRLTHNASLVNLCSRPLAFHELVWSSITGQQYSLSYHRCW